MHILWKERGPGYLYRTKWVRKSLAEWREELDISQQELATLTEVSVSTVSKWERGVHEPGRKNHRVVTDLIHNRLKGVGGDLHLLKLSSRTSNSLRRHGIDTIKKVTTLTEDDLLECRGLGRGQVAEIQEKLQTSRLTLKGEDA